MARPEIAMTDSASHSLIPDDAAVLIERAVRGELSPEERSRLDALIGADPVVAEELERAKREEDAMNTAAMLLSERSDPERMRMAIEQKLKLDRKMNLRIGTIAVLVLLVYALLRTPYDGVSWIILGVPLLPIMYFVARDQWRYRLFQRSQSEPTSLPAEYGKHIARSRHQVTIGRAIIILVAMALTVMAIDHALDGLYGKAAFAAACGIVLVISAGKSLFNCSYQKRYDEFLQGRLTLEELFDKRAESTEPDAE